MGKAVKAQLPRQQGGPAAAKKRRSSADSAPLPDVVPVVTAKPGRQRKLPAEMIPSPLDARRVKTATRHTVEHTASVLNVLDQFVHPVARAQAAQAQLEALEQAARQVKAVRDEAILVAYTEGASRHGWYGFGAIGSQLGLTQARVRQIVEAIARGTDVNLRDVKAERDARDMLRKGASQRSVIEATGLARKRVGQLAAEIRDSG